MSYMIPDDSNKSDLSSLSQGLSMEAQFNLVTMVTCIDAMDESQAKVALKDLYALMLRKDAMFKQILKQELFP